MSRTTPTFYVFHGEDEFTIREVVQDFKQKIGDAINIREFDDPKTPAAVILSEAQQIPFLADRRLVVVYGMLSFLGKRGAGAAAKEELERLLTGLPLLPDSARLVFVENTTLSDSHPILQLIHQTPTGYVKKYDVPKNPVAWIQKHVQTYDVKIEPQAAQALASVIGNDLRRADAELDKMAAFVGIGGTITERVVALLTPYVGEADIFEMVDAIGRRDGYRAMTLLHHKIEHDEQDPMQLFGMIIRQFRLLLLTREVMDEGGNVASVANQIGQKSFVAKKLVQQARNFSLQQLEAIYFHLLDTDIAVKSGKVDIHTALDLFVGSIT
ncbi:MAG: DNA polymerase III subunit delta [Phototrophicales bacterium]|nr:MAG: DNA polymerase III subunit delta [Phototrophicales bacterium]